MPSSITSKEELEAEAARMRKKICGAWGVETADLAARTKRYEAPVATRESREERALRQDMLGLVRSDPDTVVRVLPTELRIEVRGKPPVVHAYEVVREGLWEIEIRLAGGDGGTVC